MTKSSCTARWAVAAPKPPISFDPSGSRGCSTSRAGSKEIGGFGAATAHLAVHDDFVIRVQLVLALRDVPERNQHRTPNAVDLILVRLADVDDLQRIATVE